MKINISWKGIDVSDNQGAIDWKKVRAAGVQFAVLRSVRRSGKTDNQFTNNVAGCRANDIPFDVYKYTYAITEDAARVEAQQVISLLNSIGADKSVIIWWDVEDRDTLCGLGRDKLTSIISAAKSIIVASGYRFGLYVGLYVFREKWFDFSPFAADPLWVARYPVSGEKDLSFNPPESYKPDADVGRAIWGWQFSSSGRVDGISGFVDLDICYVDPTGEIVNIVTAESVLSVARALIGCNEADGSHKKIIDIYNSHRPLARGYTVKYTDSWCATFASAVAIVSGCTGIIPTECSCAKMIELFRALGEWVEDDSYIPHLGDYIFYDWQDTGVGDNVGNPDHVGIVESVTNDKITVIEGNKDNAVGRRTLTINNLYIRGYGVPKYVSAFVPEIEQVEESGAIYTVSVADVWTRQQAETMQKQFAAIGINGVIHKVKVLE